MSPQFSLAPLQGITDYAYRNLFNKHFKGVDKFYTPFLRLLNDKSLKKKQHKDVLPENNSGINLIPQILCNNSEDFIYLVNLLSDLGYKEVNWNLGCPYPMVAKRKLGSGMLPFPDLIKSVLDESLPDIKAKISIKLRAGYEDENEIIKVLEVFNEFPISEVILHPRIGKQLYKGEANPDIIEKCKDVYLGKFAYNGDIHNIQSFERLKLRFPKINHWMIGRALISNPFLVEEILNSKSLESQEKQNRFKEFHYELSEYYKENLNGAGHLQNKMLHLWEYFWSSFTDGKKILKQIKKAKTIDKLESIFDDIFIRDKYRII